MNTPKIGIQLYSVRRLLKEDFEGTVEKVAAMGFQGVELAFKYGGKEPKELANIFSRNNLEIIGIYETIDNVTSPDSALYRYMEAFGCKYVTFGITPDFFEKRPFEDCVALCHRCLHVIRSKGYIPLYHAHTHEFIRQPDGLSHLDRLFQAPELADMLLEADTCWIQQAGLDVMPYLETHARRIPLIHAKDLGKDGNVTEVGHGVIDFSPVVAFARLHSIPWLIYEQDFPTVTECESAQDSIRYMQSLLG